MRDTSIVDLPPTPFMVSASHPSILTAVLSGNTDKLMIFRENVSMQP